MMKHSKILRPGKAFVLVLAAAAAAIAGCADDPYSQKRIQMRWNHFNELVNDLARSEAARPGKVDAAIRTVERAWDSDVARFNEIAPTVGDYFW